MADILEEEVIWYRKNGNFPQRIKKNSHGKEFVEGDCSWNRKINKKVICPHCGKPLSEAFEEIEDRMKKEINYKELAKGKTDICPICGDEKPVEDLHRNCGK